MLHRLNRIALSAGVAVAVIGAMAAPASARASAGAQANTPVPVDVIGNLTWTWDSTPINPIYTITGADKQTGTFHIDLTNEDANGNPAGDSSTYSITDSTDISYTENQTGCKSATTGSFSGSGSFPLTPVSLGPYLYAAITPTNPNIDVIIGVPFTETQTTTRTGPQPDCMNATSTGSLSQFATPECLTSTGGADGIVGVFQGTYPNGTVHLACSGTFANTTESGSYSITGTLTITPSCNSANAGSPTPASSASAASAPGNSSCPVHYTVTVEQWIPQSSVVDPLMPLPVPYLATFNSGLALADPNCLQTPLPAGIRSSIVRSTYHGDGHADFGGTYRAEFELEFDFDGQSITNFNVDSPQIGTTIRNKTYTAHGMVIASCSASGVAKFQGGAERTSDTSFTMNAGGANPLVPGAPAFHAALSGTLTGNGDLQLSGNVTDFPSQGIQVTENGQPVLTDVANDVSCLSESQVTGLRGVFNLTRGLLGSHDVDASASGAPMSEDNPSPLC